MTSGVLPPGRSRRLVRAVACMGLFGIPVLVLAFAVRQKSGTVIQLDEALSRAATTFTAESGIAPALVVVQEIAQPVVVYSVVTPVVVWAWLGPKLRGRALWAFVTMMSSWGIGALAKLVVQRARPVFESPLSHPTGYSFPSGHALNIAAAGTALLVLLWPLLPAVWRPVAVTVAVLIVGLVGADRVLLGAHFPSDVIAGHLLGLGITVSSWMAFVAPTAETSSSEPSHPPSASGA